MNWSHKQFKMYKHLKPSWLNYLWKMIRLTCCIALEGVRILAAFLQSWSLVCKSNVKEFHKKTPAQSMIKYECQTLGIPMSKWEPSTSHLCNCESMRYHGPISKRTNNTRLVLDIYKWIYNLVYTGKPIISVLTYNRPNPSTPDPKHNLQTKCEEAVIYMNETM